MKCDLCENLVLGFLSFLSPAQSGRVGRVPDNPGSEFA